MTGPTPTRAGRLWSRRDTALLGLLLSLALLRGLLFASISWPWFAPDEPDHVELALLTGQLGPVVLPEQRSRGLRLQIAQSLYEWRAIARPPRPDEVLPGPWAGEVGRQPPLFYLLGGGLARLVPSDDIVARLYAVRCAAVLLGMVVVAGAYLAGRLLSPSSPLLAVALAGGCLFQTQVGGLSGAANNDIMAIAAATWTLTASIGLVQRTPRGRGLVLALLGLALAVAAAVLAKRTALVVLPAVGLALLTVGWVVVWPPLQRRLKRPALTLALATVAGLGGALALSLAPTAAGLTPRPWLRGLIERLTNRPYELVLRSMETLFEPRTADQWHRLYWEPFGESLWGRLGRVVELNMPGWWYQIHGLLLLAAMIGLLIGLGQQLWRRAFGVRAAVITLQCGLTLLGAGLVALGPYLLELYAGPPFGRYFLPALLPLVAVSALGLIWPWPTPLRGVALTVWLALLAWLDAYALLGVLLPHFAIRPPGVG